MAAAWQGTGKARLLEHGRVATIGTLEGPHPGGGHHRLDPPARKCTPFKEAPRAQHGPPDPFIPTLTFP